jgi:predicted RNA-binding Zn ribbon-like protein
MLPYRVEYAKVKASERGVAGVDPLWAELINSDWHDHLGSGRREDRIDNDAWLAGFLALTGWPERRLPAADERANLRALRGVLRRSVDGLLRSKVLAVPEIAALNRVLAACPTVWRLEAAPGRHALVQEPMASGIQAVLGAVAASFAEMLARGEPDRIKLCANPDCCWVMYDLSRNRTRRWCEAAVCGSLIKVRRFRSRQRSVSPAGR